MASFEQYIIIGNVGRDPEMRYTPAGQAVTSFSIAVSNQYKSASGETVKETKWIRVSAWGKLAEVCNQYVKKGMSVQAIGKLKGDENGNPRVWEKNGKHGAAFEMTASGVTFLSHSEGESNPAQPVAQTGAEDDIPF